MLRTILWNKFKLGSKMKYHSRIVNDTKHPENDFLSTRNFLNDQKCVRKRRSAITCCKKTTIRVVGLHRPRARLMFMSFQ
mmetsp:Transcript_18403/g.27926  ORF Transcript_18403/g.27926 Transcript_18403/m.27926 type:complete len:80 (+) Transcript_18403:775-1014(+)